MSGSSSIKVHPTSDDFSNGYDYLIIPCFNNDEFDGVPPFCGLTRWCPLNRNNPLTNTNDYVRKIGPFGYNHFDLKRKLYFGLVSIFTVFAMVLTLWGCCALSLDPSIIQRTYWAGGTGFNSTSSNYFSMYIGLQSLEFVDCEYTSSFNSYAPSCQRQSIKYFDSQCKSGPVSSACQACARSAVSMWSTAVFTLFGLVLNVLGAQTRAMKKADIPVQKWLGMIGELQSFISLAVALFVFQNNCLNNLHNAFNVKGVSTQFWIGPGMYCYAFCCASGGVRAVVHWLTPLPGMGAQKPTDIFKCERYSKSAIDEII